MFFSDQYTVTGVSTIIQVLCMILKMNISATFVVAYIQANSNVPSCCGWCWFFCIDFPFQQAMEVFPTSVRQSGIGFCSFISQMISIGGPYAMAAGAVNVMVG